MPSAPGPEEDWSLSDVFLLTDSNDGRVAIPDLHLEMTAAGITLAKHDDEPVWSCQWEGLRQLTTTERSALPDGREGVVLELVERAGRRHRFVLPAEEPARLEERLREVATSHRLSVPLPRRAVSRSLTVLVVLATLATLAALMLAAAHVVYF